MVDPNGMEAIFSSQTGALESATGKDAQNYIRGLQKANAKQQPALRNAKLSVSGTESEQKGYLRDGGLQGKLYEVPLYKATLSGTDGDGNEQNYEFYVTRVGVKGGEKKSLASGKYTIDKWDPKAIGNNGGFRFKGHNLYFLHLGSSRITGKYETGGYMNNYGCIAFCFAKGGDGSWGGNAFDTFADNLSSLTGTGDRETVGDKKLLTVELEEFTSEPSIKEVGTFSGEIIGKKRNGEPDIRYTNKFNNQ
jgi:hypothetical protein